MHRVPGEVFAKEFKMKQKLIALFLALLTISACASGATTVLVPSQNGVRASSLSLVEANHTVAVSQEAKDHYRKKLAEELFGEGGFEEGAGIVLRYRFIQLDMGSRAKRYFFSFGSGKGSVTIETEFLDVDGNMLARIESGGEISGGIFGGAFNESLEKAAQQAANFAIKNFLNP